VGVIRTLGDYLVVASMPFPGSVPMPAHRAVAQLLEAVAGLSIERQSFRMEGEWRPEPKEKEWQLVARGWGVDLREAQRVLAEEGVQSHFSGGRLHWCCESPERAAGVESVLLERLSAFWLGKRNPPGPKADTPPWREALERLRERIRRRAEAHSGAA
jgi:hypothetical protein